MKYLSIFFAALVIALSSCRPTSNTSDKAVVSDAVVSDGTASQIADEPSQKSMPMVEEEREASPSPADNVAKGGKTGIDEEKKAKEKTPVLAKKVSIKTVNSDFSVDYLMGKFDPNTHPDFVTIKSVHASKGGMRLRKETYEAFEKMYNAALKDGVRLTIISATRPFVHQKGIWEAKWTGKRAVNGQNLPPVVRDEEKRARLILMYSSMPGTSRHHWGTDMDFNDLNNSYFASGTGKKIYDWLVAHANEYGFCQVYSPKGDNRFTGYEEEKWHWSYVPIARRLTNLYKEKIKDEDISGFEGANTAVMIGMVDNYVLGINPDCK